MRRHRALFLPGIVTPARIVYAPLLEALGDDVDVVTKELEVYALSPPSSGYTFSAELDGVDRVADAAGFDRFHLYGSSGGGAVALAYVAARPERVLSLALYEPASDFSPEAQEGAREDARVADGLPPDQALRAFADRLLRPAAPRPAPSKEPPPSWMAARPEGIRIFALAMSGYDVPPEAFRLFDRPVAYSYGSLSDERWERMAGRFASWFPDLTIERVDGLSHLRASHVAQPGRVARSLIALWDRAT